MKMSTFTERDTEEWLRGKLVFLKRFQKLSENLKTCRNSLSKIVSKNTMKNMKTKS